MRQPLAELRRPLTLLTALSLALSVGACEDDAPTDPGNGGGPVDGWTEVVLAPMTPSNSLWALDCGGPECMAVGLIFGTPRTDLYPGTANLVLARSADGSWNPATVDGLPDANLFGLALDGSGQAVFAATGYSGASVSLALYDTRPATPVLTQRSSALLREVAGDAQFFVAAGYSPRGLLMTSTTTGVWAEDTLPLTGRNDSGFEDVDVVGSRAVACGFDDGADTLQVVLSRTLTTDWTHLNRNGLPFGVSLKCIALSGDSVYVGGMAEPGGLNSRAFLSLRDAQGNWTSIVLPDPVAVGGVNDILVASDDTIYLACGGELDDSVARILRASAAGVVSQVTPFPGRMHALAEAPDGTVYAAGERRRADSTDTDAVLFAFDPR